MFRIIPRYEATQLGLPYPVILEEAAEELLDDNTSEPIGIRIPNLDGLVAAVAVCRCLDAHRMTGAEVRFIRRALGYTQKELASALEVDANTTISRWENDARGFGGYCEKALRMLAIIELGKKTPGISASKEAIVRLRLIAPAKEHPIITAQLVRVKTDHGNTNEWDVPLSLAA